MATVRQTQMADTHYQCGKPMESQGKKKLAEQLEYLASLQHVAQPSSSQLFVQRCHVAHVPCHQTQRPEGRRNDIRHLLGGRQHQKRSCIISRVRQTIVRRTVRLLALLAASQRIEVDDRPDLFSAIANVKRSPSVIPDIF